MNRKLTKVTILLIILALLLSMGAVFASAEEQTDAPVLNVTRLDHTGSVYYTGGNFSPALCYEIVNYDELTAYYGSAPVWTVTYSEGGENYFSADDQGSWLRVDFTGFDQEPAEFLIEVMCSAGEQSFFDSQEVVVREHPVGAPGSLNFPTIIDGVTGEDLSPDISNVMPEGWLEDGVTYVLGCGSYSSGVNISLTDDGLVLNAPESGIYLMYLQVECSTYLLQHNFVYRVADAEGNVPQLPLSLVYSGSASEPVTLYVGGTETGMSLGSISPDSMSMQELLKGGTPEWTVTCTSGDESLIRADVLTNGVEFYLNTVASQPQTVTFDVTCTWGDETVQRDFTVNVVEPDFDMPSCLLPDEMTFDLGEERTIALTDVFSTDGLDETTWPINRWMNGGSSAIDYVINEDQMVIRALTPGIYQAEFCMTYANIRVEKRVVVYIRDAEGNTPTIPQPIVAVDQHYDTLYTGGNSYPSLASLSLTNYSELMDIYGYNYAAYSVVDVQGGDHVYGFSNDNLMLSSQPTTAGTTVVTVEIFLDHSNDVMDQSVTQTLAFQVAEPAQELLNGTYEPSPVSAQLGETIIITPSMLVSAYDGVSPEDITITGWNASSAGELVFVENDLTLSAANAGAHRLWINWASGNLNVGSWLPVLVAYEDGTPAEIPTLSLSSTTICDTVFIQRDSCMDLVSFNIDNSDALYQYYQNYPEWTVTIENDVDGFIFYNQNSWGVNTGMNWMPTTPGDVTVTVSCTLGGQTQTLGHLITVSDQGQENFCGISFPAYLQVQQGEVFSLDAISLLADDSWRLPTGTPYIQLTGNDNITPAGVDGTICSWTASVSGVHRVGMYWRWGNYMEYNALDIIVADENGVYPTVEPDLNLSQHYKQLYVGGNRTCDIAYLGLDNYGTLSELYGIDTVLWDVTVTDGCGAELAIGAYGSNYAQINLTAQPTAAGTLTAEIRATFDYADDSLNTTYTFPLSYTVIDPGVTFSGELVQLDDTVTEAGVQFTIDMKALMSEEALATLTYVSYAWPSTNLDVYNVTGDGILTLQAYESGVYRVELSLLDANVEARGTADVYVTDESGAVPSKPALEITEDIYNTTIYCNTGMTTDLLALTVRDSAALERYYGTGLGWYAECIGDDAGVVTWSQEDNGVEKTLRFSMWNAPCTANEITLRATAVIGSEKLERTYVIRCVNLGDYSSGTPYVSGPWEMQAGQSLVLPLSDILPPEVDTSSATFSFSQTSGTDYAQMTEMSLGGVVLEAVQSGVAMVSFDWNASNASGTCSTILRIADEEGNLPAIPTVSITESVVNSTLYTGGDNNVTVARYTLENVEDLVELYGMNPVWNITFSDETNILGYYTEGAWNETLCLFISNIPDTAGEITANVSCGYGSDKQSLSHTFPIVDAGMPMYGTHIAKAWQAQVGDTVTLSLSDILPAAINPADHAEFSISQVSNQEYVTFEQNGSDAVFTIQQSGVISAYLQCYSANLTFYIRVVFLVADDTGVYPELPEISMDRTVLQETVYVGGSNATDVITYALPDNSNIGNAYGTPVWNVEYINDINIGITHYTHGNYNEGLTVYVFGMPQEASVVTVKVSCELGDFSYSDSFDLTVAANPGFESDQHIDYGEVQTAVNQSVTLPIADLLPQGVDPTSADFVLTQTSSTEFAELTSWNSSEVVFAMHTSAVIGMRLQWSISNITGTALITFVAADEEGNVPTAPEFFLTEDIHSSVMYIGGGVGGTTLVTYSLNDAKAYYAYTGEYPVWNYTISGQDTCYINMGFEGNYLGTLSFHTCCAPWETGEITIEVSCDYAGQSDSFTHTISIVEGPSMGDFDTVEYGPVDLPLNEGTAINPALILPEGVDLTNARLFLRLDSSDGIVMEDVNNTAIILRAAQSGYARASFRWTSSNRAGYSNVIFRIADENGVYPGAPAFSVEKNVVNDTIYTNADAYVTLVEYTVPDAAGLAILDGTYVSWNVSFDQDPESVMWYEYSGNYNETLRIYMMNMPYSAGTLNATITCEANGETYTDALVITVAEHPGSGPDFIGISTPICTQAGQTFSIDAMSLIQEWTLPTGAPTLRLDGGSSLFQLVETDGAVYTWKATEALAENISLQWNWSNFAIYTSVIIIVNDENGNPPAVDVQSDSNTHVEHIFTGGNLYRDIGSAWVGNYQVLDTLYDLDPIEWSYTLETDTGLTVRDESWDEGITIRIADQPVSAGEATLHITGYAAAADPANNFSFTETLVFLVVDPGAYDLSSMDVVTASIDEEVTVSRTDVVPAALSGYTDCINWWYDNYIGMWMSEDSDEYDKFVISESGLCSVVCMWDYANLSGRYALVVQSPDDNGEVPAVPDFEITRTEHNTVLSSNGNNSWTDLFRYELADAEALTRINGGSTPRYEFNSNSDVVDASINFSQDGNWAENMRVCQTTVPGSTGTINIRVTCSAGGYSQTFNEVVTVVEGPDAPPADLAVEDVIQVQAGQTFSIDAAAFTEDWSMPAGAPTLAMGSDAGSFEYVGCEGTVYTWRALNRGLFNLPLQWQWSNYSAEYPRILSVAGEDGVYPSTDPEFTVNYTADTLYTEGNVLPQIANVIMTNYGDLTGLKQYHTISWHVESIEGPALSIDLGWNESHAYLNLSSSPTQTGTVQINLVCTLDSWDDANDTVHTIPLTVTVAERPAGLLENTSVMDPIYVELGGTFALDFLSAVPEELRGFGNAGAGINGFSGALHEQSNDGYTSTILAAESGIWIIDCNWNASNLSGNSRIPVIVADENGVYPSTEPEFSVTYVADTVYTGGNYYPRLADVTIPNYATIVSLKDYHTVSWSVESIDGVAISVDHGGDGSGTYINLASIPTETGTSQINLVCTLDSYNDAYDMVRAIPLTITVTEPPAGVLDETYMMDPVYVELGGTFALEFLSAVPEELRGCANASGYVSNYDGPLTEQSNDGITATYHASQSGIWIINCGWNAGNLTGNSRLLVVVADESGVYPEIPELEIQTEVLTDTVYTAGNTSWFDLATFTMKDVQLVNEINGGHGFDWSVSIEGDNEGILDYYHGFMNDTASVLHLRLRGYPSTPCDVTATVTGYVGPKQTTSTVTIHIVQGPDSHPVNLAGDEIIRTQVGQTFSIDAADVYDGWSLPTGTPSLQMTSDTENFELVSVEGSVYTWRPLVSGAFAPSLEWQWNTFRMWPSRTIIVADENGVEPSLTPEFDTFAATPILYVGGSHSVCLAEAFLNNYDLLNALYGIESVTWTVSCSELDIHNDLGNAHAAAFLSAAPDAAGEATVEFVCTIDMADDSMDAVYTLPVTLTIEDAPFTIPESYRVMGDYALSMGETFTISFASATPDELADYTGEVLYWVDRHSSDLSEVFETEDSFNVTAYNSGMYLADIAWRCANVSGISRYYLLVADEEGNVPQRPAFSVTENVLTDTIYAGGNNSQTVIASYTMENVNALTELYDAMPWWNFSSTSDLLSYSITGEDTQTLTVYMCNYAYQAGNVQYTVAGNADRDRLTFENSLTIAESPEGDWPTCFADGKNLIAQTGETFTIDASALENGWSLPNGTPTLKLWCENAEFELVESSGSLYTFRAPASGIYAVDCTVDWLNYQFFFTTNILVADENGTVPSIDPEFDEWTQGILFTDGNLGCHLVKLHLANTDTLTALYDLQSVTYSVANLNREDVSIEIIPTDYWTYFTLQSQPTTAGTLTFDVLCTLDAADDADDQVITRSYSIPIEENPGLDLSVPFTDTTYTADYGEVVPLVSAHAVPSALFQYADLFEVYFSSCSEHLSHISYADGTWNFQAEQSGIGTVVFEWNLGNLFGFSNVHVLIPDENGVYPEVPAISDTETVHADTLHTGMDFSGNIVTFTLNNAAALVEYYGTPIVWEPTISNDDENLIGYTISGDNSENFTFFLNSMPSQASNITLNVMCRIGHTDLSLHHALNIYTGPGTLPTGLAIDTPIITQIGQTFAIDAAALNDGWTLSAGTPTLSLLNEENFRLVSTEGSVYTYEALSTGGFTENLSWQWTNYHAELPVSIIVTDESGSITPVEPVISVTPCFTLDDESILLYAGDGDSLAIADLAVTNADDLYLNSVTWGVDSYSDPEMDLRLVSLGNGATGYLMLDCAPTNVGSDTIVLRCIIDSLVDDFDSVHTIEVPVTVLDNPLDVADDYCLGSITLPYGESFDTDLAEVIPQELGEEACALGTANLNNWSIKLLQNNDDGQIQSWSAREPGVYRVEFFWRVSNTYGVSYYDVYAAYEDGTVPAMPTTEATFVSYSGPTIYTGGNLSTTIAYYVVEDCERLYDYWGVHPEITVDCDWGTNDVVSYFINEGHSAVFISNNVPTVPEVLTQRVYIGVPGETTEYTFDITVAEVPEEAPIGITDKYVLADAAGGTFSLNVSELLDYWTLPTGSPELIMQVGSENFEPVSVENNIYTWRVPETAGSYNATFDLYWVNYHFSLAATIIVPDENGVFAQPEFDFANSVSSKIIYVGGNYSDIPAAHFAIDELDLSALKSTYGYESIGWELTGVTGSDATFHMNVFEDLAQIFIVDQPTTTGTITIEANCILDSENDALDFVIPTSITLEAAEWTGGDYTTTGEYGPYTYSAGDSFTLNVLEMAPEGVDYINEFWYVNPAPNAVESTNWDGANLYLTAHTPGTYVLNINWSMSNITGSNTVTLHILDENGNLPPTWDITETLAYDNTLYIGGTYGVDLVSLTLENAQAVAEYAGEIVWNVEYEGDPDYILEEIVSGDYGETLLVTTEYVCQTPSDITVHVTCTAGSMGTIFDSSYPVHVVQGPETAPVVTLDDPLTTQLGQTFTLDAAAVAGDWTLPTGQPWFSCNSDKIELVEIDGTCFTFRALESGCFKAGFTWRWSTYYAYNYIDLIVYNEDGTLPLIEPSLYQHAWIDVNYAGGNSQRNSSSIFVENFDALQQLYGYGEPTWTITSSTGYEEYFTTSTYNGSSCGITLTKAPEAAASFELEVTGVFDAADDQYDQTVTVSVPITFGVVENLPEIPEMLTLDLGTTYYGGQFGFSAEDILPAGFSLPTGEIDIQTYDSFDMHDQKYTADGSFLYTAQQSGSFRMYVSWVWENFQGSAEVLLYVEPNNSNTNFDFNETDDVIHTVFTNGDVPDSHRVHLNEDMMEAYQATPVWSLKHVYGTAYDYSLIVDEDSFGATVTAASIPSYEGYGIYELSCTWGSETYTQALYITSTASYVKPTHLILPDEVTLAYTDEPYVFDALSAAIEGYDGLYESEAAQRLYVESASCELWVGYDYEFTHIKPLSTGIQTVRLRWECGNLVLYKDVVFKMLDENGELPPQWSIEETIHDDTIYIGGGYGFDLLELSLVNGPALAEYAGYIYWDVTYEGNSDNVLIKGVGGDCGERMVISTDVLPASPVDDITVHISCQVGSMGEIYSSSYVIHVVEGTYNMPTVTAPASITTQLGSTFTIDAAELVGDWSLSTGNPRILFYSDKIEHVSSEGSLHTFRALESGILDGSFVWRWNTYLSSGSFDLIVCNEDGTLPITAPTVERVDQCDTVYVGGNNPIFISSFYLTNLAELVELYGYEDIIWTITSAEGYESYFDLEDLGDEVHLRLDKQPDFEGSFELELTGLLDAMNDLYNQTVTFTIPVTFAPSVTAPARSKTLPTVRLSLGETFTVSRSDILPADWSLPTGQSQCYQADYTVMIKLLSDTEEGMTFQPQEAGMYELPIWWEWGNFGGTTYVPVYVAPVYTADFGVGTETTFERTLFLEGNVIDTQSFHVVTDDESREGTPVWDLTYVYGPDMGYTAQTSEDGREFVITAGDLPAQTGTTIMELTCTWGDSGHVIPLVFHVVSAPDGMPTGVNLPDTISTSVSETLTLTPAALPEGWSVDGVAQKLTVIEAGEGLNATSNYNDGSILVNATVPGIKKLTVQWSCANISLTKEITLHIANEDGMQPPTSMLLAYSNSEVNHYFIHEGASTDFKQMWLSNFDEIQSFYGGTPEWTLTPITGSTELTTSLNEYGTHLTVSLAELPTANDAIAYRIDCTWGDLSLSKEFTLYIHNSYVPTEQTLEPLYKMEIGDTLTITLDDVMGDEEFLNYGAEEGFTIFSFDDAFSACFDVVEADDGSYTITAKSTVTGSFIVNWSCGNLIISNTMYIVVADESGEFPELDMVVETTRPAEQTFYIGGTYTHATRFNTNNYNDLFSIYGTEAEWTLTQLSGTTQLELSSSSFASASGCSVNLASAPTAPETITFQVSCNWNGMTSYQSEVYTINVVEPECELPTSLPADPVYYANVGETVTLSASGLTPEGWTHSENDPYIILAGVNSNFVDATTTERLANGDVTITAVTPGLHKFQITWYNGNVKVSTVAYFAIPDEDGVIDGLTFKGFNNYDENSTYYLGGSSDELCGFYMTNADELKYIYGSDFRPEWSYEITSGADLVELYTGMTDDETGFFVLLQEPLSKTGTLTYTVTCSADGHVLKTWDMTANIVEAPAGLPAEIITPEKIIVNIGDTLTFGPATVIAEDWTAPEGAMVLGGVNDDSVLADAFEFAYESDGTGHYTALTPGIYEVNLYWRMSNHMLYKDVTIYVCYEDGTVPVPVIELYNEFGDTRSLYIGGNHNLANVFYLADYAALFQKYGGTPEWTVTQTSGESVGAYFVPYEYSEDMYQMFLSKTSSQAEAVELQVEVRWGDAVGTFTQTVTFSEPDFNMPTGFITPEMVELKVGETLSLPECPVDPEGLDYDDWGFGRVYSDWFKQNFTYVEYVDGYEFYRAEASGVTSITFEWLYRNYLLSQDMLIIVLDEEGNRPIPELATTREDVKTEFSVGDEPTLIASVYLSDEVFEAYSQHVTSKPTWSAFSAGEHKLQLQHREDGLGMDVYLTESPATIGSTEISVFMNWLGVTTQDTITIRVTETMPEVAIRAERFLLLQGLSCEVDLIGDLTGWTTAWSTSNSDVATVDESGVLTAVGPGSTWVTLELSTPAGSSKRMVAFVEVLSEVFTMKLPAALTTIEDEAFWGTAAGYIVLPYGVTSIGESAFAYAPNLKLVLIPATVTSIPDSILTGSSAAILCDPGSAAETYAIENEIPYYFVK